ncbi:hypothetical protein [Neobacillus soli]|uniref:hypothetical protein n=1 Tax=Neobacillus soli TaxID=220688 RepID=UPI000824A101|nr:hypothetical protein [Neobacillus soli]
MEIIRYCADPHSTVKYIKANLEFIDNITSFEVYFNDEDIPEVYRNVPDVYVYDGKRESQNRNYTLILRDDENEKEFWFSGATCGYGGSGPSATKQILQILGIKFDYNRISDEKKIIEKNLVSYHDINLMVYRPKNMLSMRREKILKVKLSFKTAHQKYRAKAALKCIGYIQPLRNLIEEHDMVEDIDTFYFRDIPYSTEKEWAEYATNNALTLNRIYSKIQDETIKEIIENIGYSFNAKIEIKMYEKL